MRAPVTLAAVCLAAMMFGLEISSVPVILPTLDTQLGTDGWENEMQYVAPGSEGRPYDLFSLGADGQQGGEGQDADIYAQL